VTVGAAEVTEQIFILLDPAWDVMFFFHVVHYSPAW